jgi:hypothetical protein
VTTDTGRDGLEHWLQDLRSDLSSDPPDWLDTTAAPAVPEFSQDDDTTDHVSEAHLNEAPVDESDESPVDEPTPEPPLEDRRPAAPSGPGRHRAPD